MPTSSPLFVSIVVIALLLPMIAAAAPSRTVYRDVMLVDVEHGTLHPHTDVLVEGERIVAVQVGASLPPASTAGAQIIVLSGRYLMAGLIDAHVHVATPPNRRQAEAVLRRDLYGGVVAVRDMADDLRAVAELARVARAGEIPSPDIYAAALMAGPAFFADPRTTQAAADQPPGHAPWMQAVTADTDLHDAVTLARGSGAVAIKLYADLDATLAARISAEAHRQRLLVWVHATLYPARPSEVVAAGVDAISHACLLVREGEPRVPRWDEPRAAVPLQPFLHGDHPALASLFAAMLKRGTVLDATVWTYAPEAADPASPPLPPGSCDAQVGGAITAQAYAAGVTIAAGSDVTGRWNDPWPELFQEMQALHVQAGMSPPAVLRAATIGSAQALGRGQEFGTIAPGKLASFVVLTGDPLQDLGNLRSVQLTVKRGRRYPRGDFQPLRQEMFADPD